MCRRTLGHEPATAGFLRARAARSATAGLLRRLGHPEIDPGAPVGSLSAAGQQIASMARALSHDVRLIVMDEPSAALDPDEVANLFRIVADLTGAGVAVVYISHRLEEVRRAGDRATALKDGRAVARDLVHAIATGAEPAPSFADGLQVQRVPAAVEDRAAKDCTYTPVPCS